MYKKFISICWLYPLSFPKILLARTACLNAPDMIWGHLISYTHHSLLNSREQMPDFDDCDTQASLWCLIRMLPTLCILWAVDSQTCGDPSAKMHANELAVMALRRALNWTWIYHSSWQINTRSSLILHITVSHVSHRSADRTKSVKHISTSMLPLQMASWGPILGNKDAQFQFHSLVFLATPIFTPYAVVNFWGLQ